MNGATAFDSTKELLVDSLQSIQTYETQLPDFQRGWIWNDDHIKSLLASVSLSWPIGAVMMLETGNASFRFKPRPIEGIEIDNPPEPERLILDGQQRLTSLFRALMHEKIVDTKDDRKRVIQRWYYLDIDKALDANGDREEAIISLPEDRKLRNFRGEVISDYSTQELECEEGLFPLNIVYDFVKTMAWQETYFTAEGAERDVRINKWGELNKKVFTSFQRYQIPLIVLKKETPKGAVCLVFEKVNTGGVKLTVFELLTATYAADDFELRKDWEAREKSLKGNKVLGKVRSDDFLQSSTLLATRDKKTAALDAGTAPENAPGISCKRDAILNLALGDYQKWADPLTAAFVKVARFLFNQKIFTARDLPYHAQLAPLAAILTVLGNRADNDGIRAKLEQWFWCGVLGELYGSAQESRFAKDLPEVLDWIDGGDEPTTVADARFYEARLYTLKTRKSAAYKGLLALIMREGARDFATGELINDQAYFGDNFDIHHIFPKKWCEGRKIDKKIHDSIINKTPLAWGTNRTIGGAAPSVYLPRLEQKAGVDALRMDELLESHQINPGELRQDDFVNFFTERRERLIALIEKAMGKPVMREAEATEPGAGKEVDDSDEEDDDT